MVVFIFYIARSTCTCREAIQLVSTISCGLSCVFPFTNGGQFSLTPNGVKSSCMPNPLSAITVSPGSSNCSIPIRLVSSLSDIDPVYKSVIAPDGEIPINTL